MSNETVGNWFGARILKIRAENKITAAKLAGSAGVNINTIYRIEEGHPPSLTTAIKLSRVLKLDLNPPDYVLRDL